MWKTLALGGAALLSGVAHAQTQKFCDSLTDICYSSYTSPKNISYRVAIPNVDAAPFDIILQVVAPIATTGWTGLAWGGTMTYNPLTVVWPNKNSSMYTSRMAYGLNLPKAYTGATYTPLKGSGANATHFTVTVLCQGCSQWGDADAQTSLLSNGTNRLAFAHATRAPSTPGDNSSTFNVHDDFGKWVHDFQSARSDQFSLWVKKNTVAPPVPPPQASSSSVVSSSSSTVTLVPTTISTVTSSRPTATPTGVVIPTSCPGVAAPKFPGKTANGWRAVKLAGGLSAPRTVIIDSAGHLLVLQTGMGVTAHTLGADGCISSTKTVIAQTNLNHGLQVSSDGKTLYASSPTSVYRWSYDASTASISGTSKTIISGMFNGGHPTRTLTIHPKWPNLLLVSHGSNDNADFAAGNMATARACIKVFDLSKIPAAGYNYVKDGYFMGWGLRNEVGLAFDGNDMLWGIENSSDDLTRILPNGTSIDIHTDNPAEELNYIGDISVPNTQWYGYPTCFSIWDPSNLTPTPSLPGQQNQDQNTTTSDNSTSPLAKFSVGDQFVSAPNSTFNDTSCARLSTPARAVFQAHSAPLDIEFDAQYKNLYIAFHGSWDRTPSTGFKVVKLPFEKKKDGAYGPTKALTEKPGYEDVWWNAVDIATCGTTNCFRPVSIAKDEVGRMFVTSDSSTEGELFMLAKTG